MLKRTKQKRLFLVGGKIFHLVRSCGIQFSRDSIRTFNDRMKYQGCDEESSYWFLSALASNFPLITNSAVTIDVQDAGVGAPGRYS